MGKTPVKKRRQVQEPIEKGTTVYFFGFTKDKKTGPTYYLCKGIVIESPSAFNKAPHKVKVTGTALSRFHKVGLEEDARSLLGKELHLPIDKLSQDLQSWLIPDTWWL